MKYILMALLGFTLSTAHAREDESVITHPSNYTSTETLSRLNAALKERGLTVFAAIDHADGAEKAGLKMPFSTLTIFGDPKGGTPFMVAAPHSALDFPLKALVWEDGKGKVFYSYTTLDYIVGRHHIKGQNELAIKLDKLQAALAKTATE